MFERDKKYRNINNQEIYDCLGHNCHGEPILCDTKAGIPFLASNSAFVWYEEIGALQEGSFWVNVYETTDETVRYGVAWATRELADKHAGGARRVRIACVEAHWKEGQGL